jgi:hypothetical protein
MPPKKKGGAKAKSSPNKPTAAAKVPSMSRAKELETKNILEAQDLMQPAEASKKRRLCRRNSEDATERALAQHFAHLPKTDTEPCLCLGIHYI